MSYKVKQFWCNLDLNCPFAWKGDFLGKLTNAAIVYLLRPVMLQSLKIFLSIGQGMRYKVLQFWDKLGANNRFTFKGNLFWKIKWC